MSQLKVNSIVPVGGLPSGSNGGIIQVKQTVKTDVFSQNTVSVNTFSNDTGVNVTITPTLTSSKIRITGFINMSMSDDNGGYGIALYKGGSILATATGDADSNRGRVMAMSMGATYGGECRCIPFDFIDSPATTSATTYGIRIGCFSGSSTSHLYVNRTASDDNNAYRTRSISVITAEEVTV